MGLYTKDNMGFIYDAVLKSAEGTFSAAVEGSFVKVGGHDDNMFMIVDVSALAITVDQKYSLLVQGTNSIADAPAENEVINVAQMDIGAGQVLHWATAGKDLGKGRYAIPFPNMIGELELTRVRFALTVAGTTPSITCLAFVTARP